MISNLVIAHLAACRFHYQGQTLKLARERIRLSMGALKVLGEYWTMGQRTYREVGIVAREILGLKDASKRQHHQETLARPANVASTRAVTMSDPPSEDQPEPQSTLLPEAEVEFPDVSDYLGQPSLADIQLLDTDFDFCGLFDMNAGVGANVNVSTMAVV
jgi:hypothetical protein